MAEVHLDHPGEITWFKSHGPAAVLGDCPHTDCAHDMVGVIAWGPDYDHYVLVRCLVENGCNRQCRAWQAEYPPQMIHRDPSLPSYRLGKFQHVDVPLTEVASAAGPATQA